MLRMITLCFAISIVIDININIEIDIDVFVINSYLKPSMSHYSTVLAAIPLPYLLLHSSLLTPPSIAITSASSFSPFTLFRFFLYLPLLDDSVAVLHLTNAVAVVGVAQFPLSLHRTVL